MSQENMSLYDRAVAAYKASSLYKRDEAKLLRQKMALQIVLRELGVEAEPEEPVYEIEDFVLTAPMMGDYGVEVQAHYPCPLCGVVRHSPPILVDDNTKSVLRMRDTPDAGAAEILGQWLSQPHQCTPQEKKRPVGLRAWMPHEELPDSIEG